MSLTDPIGDMLTRIRNAQMRRRDTVATPASTLRGRVLDVLKSEGFIRGYSEQQDRQRHRRVRDRAEVLRQHAGDPHDRARLASRPPRLCVGQEYPARSRMALACRSCRPPRA